MASPKPIKIKTENEHTLYNAYNEEKTKRHHLETIVTDLQNEVKSLRSQLAQLLEQQKTPVNQEKNSKNTESSKEVQYETDEEELARETGWIRQKSRKKRKLNTSLSPSTQQGAVDSGEKTTETPRVKKIPSPPPIIVENVKDYQKFYDLLLTILTIDSFVVKMMNGASVKINAKNEVSYKAIAKLLLENNCLWHSYENKQDRPIRVMAKNLHSSCLPTRIVEYLISQEYKIQEAVNKLSWKTKQPLNMFMLSFEKDEDINKIYSIKSILGCKVEIQPLRSSKLIPQCKRCQAYGHTQKYCAKEPRCVKCTGKHLTKDCKKPAEAKPKCVHCGESHPANYRGCTVAKELQHIKNKANKQTDPVSTKQTRSGNKNFIAHQHVTKNVSFAQMAKGSQPVPKPQSTCSTDEKINTILRLVSSFDERLKKLEGSTTIATGKPKQK